MKTATKVFLIIDIIRGFVLILAGLIIVIAPTVPDARLNLKPFGVIVIILGAVILTMCIIALVKLCKAVRATDISTGLKVCVLIFGSLIGGILLLCMKDADYSPESAWQTPPQNGHPPYNDYSCRYDRTPPPTNPPPFDAEAPTFPKNRDDEKK